MQNDMAAALEAVRAVVAEQPFTQLLGAQVTSVSENGCELTLALRKELTQQHGFAHGGVISYMADNAVTIAGGKVLQASVVTSEFKVNYIRPGIGDSLIAQAECLHAGRSQAVCRCEVYAVKDGVEKLCAAAQATIVLLGKPKD